MRLSIWQQLSSNHSADFTVVGVFQTPQDAEKAASEVRGLFEKIQQWTKHLDIEQFIELMDGLAPTPPELEMAEKYELVWDKHLDWYSDGSEEDAVSVFDRLVFINPVRDSYLGVQPINQLLERLGSQVAVDGHKHGSSNPMVTGWITIQCVIPNQTAATVIERMYGALGEYVEVRHDDEKIILSLSEGVYGPSVVEKVMDLRSLGCTDFRYSVREETHGKTGGI